MSDNNDREMLRAVSFALYKHGKQRRNARNAAFIPYMVHPIEVATILVEAGCDNIVTLQTAILHDVLEDTDCTEEEMSMLFGHEVTALVKVLTLVGHPKGDVKTAQQKEAMQTASFEARAVKIADKTSNLRDLLRCPPGWPLSSIVGYTTSAYKVMKSADHGDIPQPLLRSFWEAYSEIQAWIQEQDTTLTKSTSAA